MGALAEGRHEACPYKTCLVAARGRAVFSVVRFYFLSKSRSIVTSAAMAVRTLGKQIGRVESVAFSPDRQWLASASWDKLGVTE